MNLKSRITKRRWYFHRRQGGLTEANNLLHYLPSLHQLLSINFLFKIIRSDPESDHLNESWTIQHFKVDYSIENIGNQIKSIWIRRWRWKTFTTPPVIVSMWDHVWIVRWGRRPTSFLTPIWIRPTCPWLAGNPNNDSQDIRTALLSNNKNGCPYSNIPIHSSKTSFNNLHGQGRCANSIRKNISIAVWIKWITGV